jgi:hypothetical protein
MINFHFLFIFFIIKSIISNNLLYYSLNDENSNQNLINNLTEDIYEYIRFKDFSYFNNLELNDECKNNFIQSFFNEDKSENKKYYQKFFIDSSNTNNIHSYQECLLKNNLMINFTYLTVLINGNNKIYDTLFQNNNFSSGYLVGLCIFEGCTTSEYKNIILKSMELLNFTRPDNNNNKFNNNSIISEKKNYLISEIEVYNLNVKASKGFIKYLEYIPYYIILIHIFFVIFNNAPLYLYNLFAFIFCCKRNKIPIGANKSSNYSFKKREKNLVKGSNFPINNDRNPSISILITNIDNFHKSINLLYNISKNYSSLVVYKKQSEITNDSGLSYICGIKGISMIFLIFGSVYINLYNAYLVDKDVKNFFEQLGNIYFSIFYIGIKYAPKLLLCTSGFLLFFKFICFMDGRVENEEEINRQRENKILEQNEEKKDINNSSNSNTNSFYRQLRKSSEKLIINRNDLISFKNVLTFYGMQLNKYLIYILFTCFILFSLNRIIILIDDSLPIWNFFNEKMINSVKKSKYLIIPLITGFKSYLIHEISNKDETILDYFHLVFQEIIYFIISTIIIFIGYKKNLRIDRFFKLTFILLIIFRIVYYIKKGMDDKNYFSLQEYGKFYTSLIYNYTFYIIGIHFGMINYAIQKGYSFRDCSTQNKVYLIHSLRILRSAKKRSKKCLYIIAIISAVILILSIFLQQFIISFYDLDEINEMKNYKKNIFSQILMFIDSDIFVFVINIMALSLYIKGDNIINNILCHNFWFIFNRFYFSYILLINPIILYIIYINETKIIFNFSTIILYCFICGIVVYFLTILVYITFELPFKKLIYFWIKLNENANMLKRETTYSYELEHSLLNSATASLTDFIDEEEEDED